MESLSKPLNYYQCVVKSEVNAVLPLGLQSCATEWISPCVVSGRFYMPWKHVFVVV